MTKLRYIGVQHGKFPLSVDTDPYVFLVINVTDSHTVHPPLSWRLVDETHNLISVSIDRDSGRFLATKVVFYKGTIQLFSDKKLELKGNQRLEGLPQFSPDLWEDNLLVYDYANKSDFHDVPGRALIELYEDGLRLQLFPNQEVDFSTVYSTGLACEFNIKSELIAISVRNMSKVNRESVKRYAERHGGFTFSS